MNEYEITIGVFYDETTYGDCENHHVSANHLCDATLIAQGISYVVHSSDKPARKRELLYVKRIR